jgi:gluconate 5-dehydrogenase
VNLQASHLFSLEGKTALLTGASGFLGRTFALTLLENGARVLALGRSERLHAEARQWRQKYGERVQAYRIDMYDTNSFPRLLDEIVARESRVDVLINNAHELGTGTGFNTPEGTLENADLEQWTRNFMGGAWWPALAVQKVAPVMKRAGGGSIINISTMYAMVAPDPQLYAGTSFLNPPGYSAAKAALLAFTRYAASFLGADNIRANALLPGPFSNIGEETPNSVGAHDPFLERLRARTCLGRTGVPNELAGALLYLASDASTYMTGQSLIVDGGWTVR